MFKKRKHASGSEQEIYEKLIADAKKNNVIKPKEVRLVTLETDFPGKPELCNSIQSDSNKAKDSRLLNLHTEKDSLFQTNEEREKKIYCKQSNITVDYNQEICKDFNETGYCGFGNTCIFIHDRHQLKNSRNTKISEWSKYKKRSAKHYTANEAKRNIIKNVANIDMIKKLD